MDWYASDLHFNHHNILVFDPPRPFLTIEEHNEEIIRRWNCLVSPKDNCLLLGDLSFNTGLPLVGRLNGKKKLIMGNHEHKNISEYLPYFEDIKAYREDKKLGILFSHIPVHESQLERWKFNVHGHTHSHNITKKEYSATAWTDSVCNYADLEYEEVPDKRYINISLEQTAYAPLSHDELMERVKP